MEQQHNQTEMFANVCAQLDIVDHSVKHTTHATTTHAKMEDHHLLRVMSVYVHVQQAIQVTIAKYMILV